MKLMAIMYCQTHCMSKYTDRSIEHFIKILMPPNGIKIFKMLLLYGMLLTTFNYFNGVYMGF